MSKALRAALLLPLIIWIFPLCTGVKAAARPEARAYLYGGRSPIYTNNVQRSLGCLDVVLVDYFEIGWDGEALITHTPDTAFIKARQEEGYKVLAYVSNHWSRSAGIEAMNKRSAVTTKLADWVVSYGLDGVDVDIENLNASQRDAFTDFCRQLRKKLPPEKQVTVAVAPNPWGISTGWQGQYDYASLGAICDVVLLMTYDQSYQGGEAGPVASYDFTEQSVKQALKHIPSEKLLAGIPFYGRYWAAYNSGGMDKGRAFTVSDVEAITEHYPSNLWYDEENHCARALVTVGQNDPGIALWGGKKLAAGIYDIWYENERSLRTRMELVRKYNLAGVGAWALGQEPERFWQEFRTWLRSLPFMDISGHWAETELCELYDLGLIKGVDENLFAPGRDINRGEFCVLLCRLLGLEPMSPPDSASELQNHWAGGYLWNAVLSGLLEGDGTGYHPDRPLTRAELAAFCERVMNVPDTMDYNQSFYEDITPEQWLNKAVVTATVYGILKGRGDGRFHPGERCTRAEAAVVMRRLLDVEKKSFGPAALRRFSIDEPLEPR